MNCSILFYRRNSRENKKGLAPIQCRVTINGNRDEFSTRIKRPKRWDYCKVLLSIQKKLEDLCLVDKITCPKKVIYLYKIKEKGVAITDILNLYNGEGLKDETVKKHLHFIAQIKLYHKIKGNITWSIAESKKFILWYSKSANCSKHHASRAVKILSNLFSLAEEKGLVDINPLFTFKQTPSIKKPIIYTTSSEIEILQNIKFSTKLYNDVKKLYLWLCFTGMDYVCLLDWDPQQDIIFRGEKAYISRTRANSGKRHPYYLPLFEEAQKYRPSDTKIPSNQVFNRILKEIAAIAGINKNLTTKTARKSFGAIVLRKGYSMEALSKMLGHTNTKTTQTYYAKVQNSRVMLETEILQASF